jgi:DNA topoisomerase IB
MALSDQIAARVAAKFQKKKKLDTGTVVYEYSKGQVDKRNRDKAKRLESLKGSINKLRSRVQADLKSSDKDKQLTALVIGLIDETFERVGNDQSAKEGHFGVTGWQSKHITFSGGKATIKYVGKSGVKQEKTVTNKSLVGLLKKTVSDCKGGSCFSYDGGKVTAEKVNSYLKQFDITAKDLRGYHANEEMRKHLKSVRKGGLPSDPKEKEKKLKAEWQEALELTAKAVGHEASTLKSQYLVPGMMDTFVQSGKVMKRLDKKAETASRVAARWRRRAGIEAIDLARIEKLRKDFLLLVKNVKKVLAKRTAPGNPGYDEYDELYGEFQPIVRAYKAAFDDLIFDRLIDKAIEWDERLGPEGVRSMKRMLQKPARRFSSALLLTPDLEHVDLKAWDRQIRRLAQDFWKSAKNAIKWYEGRHETEMTVQVPDQLMLEGFRVQIINYDPNDNNDPAALEKFKEALRVYKRMASKRLPWLISNQVPMVLDFKAGLGHAGVYNNGIIRIDAHSIGLGMVHILAHEMGHHMYKQIKGSAKKFWETAIKQDYGPLDLRELLAKWPESDKWASDFVEKMAAVDPVLAIQVDVLSYGHGHGQQLTRRYDFVDFVEFQGMDGKSTEVNVPKTPITGYAGKSPEEALCEAVGLLVAYGPGAVHETIRHWLSITMPGRVKFARARP